MVRQGAQLKPVGWEEALAAVRTGLGKVSEASGAQAIGFLGSARATCEDNWALMRLARAVVGCNNLDFSARMGLPLGQGSGWRTGSRAALDIEQYDALLVCEGDLVNEAPVLAGHMINAARGGVPLIVLGQRHTQLAECARTVIRVSQGGEAWALMGVLRVLSRDHPAWVRGFGKADEDARAWVHGLAESVAAERAGVSRETLEALAETLGTAGKVLLVYSQGLGMSASGEHAIAALLALGRWAGLVEGRRFEVMGASGYPNVYGAHLAGVLPRALGEGGEELPSGRALAERWGVSLPSEEGVGYPEMLSRVRALFVMQDDPLRHLAKEQQAREALRGMEFVVVQDYLPSALLDYAHVVLPCTAPGEHWGTLVNMAGMAQGLRPGVRAPKEALPAWQAIGRLAAEMGSDWGWQGPEQIFEEMTSAVRACAGLTTERVERGEAWLPASKPTGAMPALGPLAEAETPDAAYPLMVAGDVALEYLASDPVVAAAVTLRREVITPIEKGVAGMALVHPSLMERLQARRGTVVTLTTRAGSAEVALEGSEQVAEGVVLLPQALAQKNATALGLCGSGRGIGERLTPRAARVEVKQGR